MSKNDELQARINGYFEQMWKQGRDVNTRVLCDLIEQWEFDRRMRGEKDGS